MGNNNRRTIYLTILSSLVMCVFAIAIVFPRISRPFIGHHDFNGVFYGQIAKNYLRYGLFTTNGAQILNTDRVARENWRIHADHPATYPLILAALFSTFGIHEWVARLFSLLSALFGMIILGNVSKYKWTIVPVLLTPLFLYYGLIPVFEPILLIFVALSLFLYQKNHPKLLFFALLGGILIDWPGYWPAIWILLVELLEKRKVNIMILTSISAILMGTGLIVLQQLFVSPASVSALVHVGLSRIRLSEQPFSNSEWIKLLISRTKAFYGLPILFCSSLGVLISLWKKTDRKILILTAGIGFSHIFIFRNITWYHDYMLYHAIPFFTLSSAVLFKHIRSKTLQIGLLLSVAALTFILTQPFYQALSHVEPHKECTDIKHTSHTEEFMQKCGQFYNFYSDSLNK